MAASIPSSGREPTTLTSNEIDSTSNGQDPASSSLTSALTAAGEEEEELMLSTTAWELIRREDTKAGGARVIEQLILDVINDQRRRRRLAMQSNSSQATSTDSPSPTSSSSNSLSASLSTEKSSSSQEVDEVEQDSPSNGDSQSFEAACTSDSAATEPTSKSLPPTPSQTRLFLEVDQLLDTQDCEALVFWGRTIARHTKILLRKAQDNAMDLVAEKLLLLVDEKFQLAIEKRPAATMSTLPSMTDLLYERGKNLLCLGKLLELGKLKALVRAHETYSRASRYFEQTLELDGTQHRVFKHWAKAIDRLAFLRPSDKTIADAVDMFLVFYSNLVMKAYANATAGNVELDELDLKPLIAIALSENKFINSKGIDVVRHLVRIMDEEPESGEGATPEPTEFQKEARKNLRFLEEILAQRLLNKKVIKFEDLPEDCKKLIKSSGLTWDAVKDNYDAFLHCLWFERSKFKTPRKVQQAKQQSQPASQQPSAPRPKTPAPTSPIPSRPQPSSKTASPRPKSSQPTEPTNGTPHNTASPRPKQADSTPKPQPPQQAVIYTPSSRAPAANTTPDPLFIYSNPASRFRDYEKIGMGAYGNVYKARTVDPKVGRPKRVAIKVMNVQNVRMLKHIRYEISVLAQCKHPNIVNYIESYYHNNCVWCVMEFCDAGTLQLLIRHYQLEEWEICYVAKQLLRAIHFLHDRNYIHRDIKPENVLLTSDGQVKLADLGLCTQLTTAIESKMAVSGSSYWIAPEMILHEPYGCKVDIWSFGCVLMEMAERKPPYGEFRALKAIFYTATKGPPKLQIPHRWTSEFVDCVETCMQYDPDNRPSSSQLIKHSFVNRTLKEKLQTIRPVMLFDL